ncbi:hypothetical protein [Candidatus Methanomassiliicoccus intestinalis]|nr:hypothetical protein [Candidatus Methanomassiliicoccus intestinalis]
MAGSRKMSRKARLWNYGFLRMCNKMKLQESDGILHITSADYDLISL